jgi:hypothetical protein
MAKNFKLSAETRKRMSEAHKGKHVGKLNNFYNKHHSEESCRKISENHPDMSGENNNFYGNKHSKETLLKMSVCKVGSKNSMWNKTHKKETKQKISESKKGVLVGDKHWNWKGGIACEPYCDVWLDKEYKQSIRDRDKNQCKNCGITRHISFKVYGLDLHIHHIDYNKKNCHPSNLITLCRSCNSRANYNRQENTEMYQQIINTGGLIHGNSSV